MMQVQSSPTALPFFAQAGTPLAAHTAMIERAIHRAMAVRASDILPPGNWHKGMMLPHLDDGSIDYDEDALIPTCGPRMVWIGGDGGA